MATNFLQPGSVINHSVSGAGGIEPGTAVAIGNIVGVALGKYAQNEVGAFATEGVFELPKNDSTGALTAGAQAFLVTGEIEDEIGAGIFAGTVWEAAGSSDETVKVRVNFGNYGEDNSE